MPATSKHQQRAMCMALAARKGDLPVSKLKGAALDIYKSDMTNKEIEDFTVLKEGMISLRDFLTESILRKSGVLKKYQDAAKCVSDYIYAEMVNRGSFVEDQPTDADYKLLDELDTPIWEIDFNRGDVRVYDQDWWVFDFGKFIKLYIEHAGNNCSLNWIDMSNVKRLNALFSYSKFNGDISKWDVSNVENMSQLFRGSKFNGDISKWNVSKVKDMGYMFAGSIFNKDISKWDTRSLENSCEMFARSRFNRDISNWNVSNLKYATAMFCQSAFNKDIAKWDLKNIKQASRMFSESAFNKDISNWDFTQIENPGMHLYNVFYGCPIKDEFKPKGTK